MGCASFLVQVEPGDSLEDIIASCPAGAVIQLGKGTWAGSFVIDKSLTIQGEGPGETEIVAAEQGVPAITVIGTQTVSVVLIGVKIGGAKGECTDTSQTLCPHGLLVTGSAHVTLVSCALTNNAGCGAFITDGAELWANGAAFIRNRIGLWVQGGRVTIHDSVLTENFYGLIATGEAWAEAEGCSISNNVVDGVLVGDRARVYLWENEIAGNGRVGISLYIKECYRTGREFGGVVRGSDNMVQRNSNDSNSVSPFCPPVLELLGTELGGIYPAVDPVKLLAEHGLSVPPLGERTAPVTILEFADFSCPFCAEFALETLPKIKKDYISSEKACLYFLPYPVHGEAARLGAEAAFCAASQGLYWDFSEAAFRYSLDHGFPELAVEDLAWIIKSVGGDPGGLIACLNAGKYRQTVEKVVAIAQELGVQGTPVFFLANHVIPGAYPYPVFEVIIDSLLKSTE